MALTPYGSKEPPMKLPARPVREILEEIQKDASTPGIVTALTLKEILPWINTLAVANENQEEMIHSWFYWMQFDIEQLSLGQYRLPFITMLNTLRG